MRPTTSKIVQIVAGAPAGLTSAELGRRLQIDPWRASGLARRIKRRGLIGRTQGIGARSRRVTLWLPREVRP